MIIYEPVREPRRVRFDDIIPGNVAVTDDNHPLRGSVVVRAKTTPDSAIVGMVLTGDSAGLLLPRAWDLVRVIPLPDHRLEPYE